MVLEANSIKFWLVYIKLHGSTLLNFPFQFFFEKRLILIVPYHLPISFSIPHVSMLFLLLFLSGEN